MKSGMRGAAAAEQQQSSGGEEQASRTPQPSTLYGTGVKEIRLRFVAGGRNADGQGKR